MPAKNDKKLIDCSSVNIIHGGIWPKPRLPPFVRVAKNIEGIRQQVNRSLFGLPTKYRTKRE